MDNLDYISVNKCFWIRVDKNSLSFGLGGLSKDIHLTISYHPNDKFLNFHITKETNGNKPKIEIFRIDKTLLDETLKSTIGIFLSNIIELVDSNTIKSYQSTSEYLPVDQIDESIEKAFLASFKENEDYKIKKKRRLKITTDFEDKIVKMVDIPEFQSFRLRTKSLDSSTEQLDSGIMIIGGKTSAIIKIDNNWYKFKERIDLNTLLKGVIQDRTIRMIKWRFKKALLLISKAKSYDDTKAYDKIKYELKKTSCQQHVSAMVP